AEVEPGDILSFLADPKLGANSRFTKLNTRGKYKARLSTFFSWCVLNKAKTGVQVNPCREIKLKAPPKQRGKMNAAVYWALYDALSPMGQCFLELMYLTRQRPTEIRLLRESHIGPERIRFKPGKTEGTSGEEVEIVRTPEINACLERARALRPKEKVTTLAKRRDPFIIQTRDGDGYAKNGIYEVWRDGVDAAGCKGITTRHVRAFALSEMEKMGISLREIQLSAAHSDLATTQIYLDQYRERFSNVRMPRPIRPERKS
ncbi:MAG TPA: tyrosine-type recombinase/integrase, partial [Burkholderiales bacterium]|nr:tyrosine-type recombinase/integrase [Burkholderiales bacterium]